VSDVADRLAAVERRPALPLSELVARFVERGLLREPPVAPSGGDAATDITGVTNDSRRVRSGALFVAVPGLHVDGHDFVAQATRSGAAAAVVERPVGDAAIPQLVTTDIRRALATASAWWYGDPSHELSVVGVTGTDGKTTTSFLAVAALEACGIATGLVSTVATRVGGAEDLHAEHATTPDPPELQAALRAMADAGDRAAVLETTSHGLALERVGEVAYDAAILTNLSHEHLDFHGSYEAYRDAKLSLFRRLAARRASRVTKPDARPLAALVNGDDPEAERFVAAGRDAGAAVLKYGFGTTNDVRATDARSTREGIQATVTGPSGTSSLELRLRGEFNVRNALAVVALGEAWRLDAEAVRRGIGSVARVPGRMEWLDRGQPFDVVVDFAHTPQGLAAVLDLLGATARARGGGVIAVFGSAGERDVAKRPLMGRIAAQRARLVIATDEDPRGEDPIAIMEAIAAGAIAAGARRGESVLVIPDRRDAIATAIERAGPGDIVLLAGKGHEQSIIGPGGPQAWDERAVAEAALAARGFGAEG
jgi:UDP-N-acetylmuramoyl-L-alanyl-D-glutamate--2,6-diaminopimelate ligase